MQSDIERIRLRSGTRNPDLDINRVPEPCEMFVHNVRAPDGGLLEIHLPIEWVGIGADQAIVFSEEGNRFMVEAHEVIQRHFGRRGIC